MANDLPSRPATLHAPRHFGIVASDYNAAYVNGLVENATRELLQIAPGSTITTWRVPGAFEIPLLVQEVARRGMCDAILALGVIIEGATAHAALIASTLTQSLQQISLQHHIPVIHEVLLVKSEEQARARTLEAELNRGLEAARVAARMVELLSSLPLC